MPLVWPLHPPTAHPALSPALLTRPQALRIPVLGNGNIRTLHDCQALMEATGVDGVMSAESLLADPALFSQRRLQVRLLGDGGVPLLAAGVVGCFAAVQCSNGLTASQPLSYNPHLPALTYPRPQPGGEFGHLDGCHLLLEYLDLVDLHPTPWRMVKGHAFQLLGALHGWWEGTAAGLDSRLPTVQPAASAGMCVTGSRPSCDTTAYSSSHPLHCPTSSLFTLPLPPLPGPWLTEFTDLRDQLNRSHEWDTERLRALVMDMLERIEATGRSEWRRGGCRGCGCMCLCLQPVH